MNFGKKLFILCFSISVSIAVLPSGIINTYGTFGEVQESVVISEQKTETEELAAKAVYKNKCVKGTNIYNIWLVLFVIIICMCLVAYCYRLPRGHTIVTLKIRMNN